MKIYERFKLWSLLFGPTFLLLANFHQIPTWKIWFQPIERIFHERNSPNLPDFEKKILPIARFSLLVPVHSQKCWRILIFSYFHISTCGQIWLNHFGDDSHLGYITKLKKETLVSPELIDPQINNILLMICGQTWSYELKKCSNFPLLAPKTFWPWPLV